MRLRKMLPTVALALNAFLPSMASAQAVSAGGLGILIGDGRFAHYGSEDILETYYRLSVFEGLAVSFDYQYVVHPAYNAERGPVMAFGLRVHAEK